MDIFQKCFDYTLPDDYKKKGLYHYFHALESRQDTTVIMEGKRRIMLGSNNYLGLTVHPEVIEAGVKAYEQYGSGCSGSRFLNGTLKMHLELEKELAEFLGKDGIVTFSTGFQTNLGIISSLVGHGDYAICDAENHASIYDGCKLSYGRMLTYPHADMAALEAQLSKIGDKGGKLIITDGVFSMGGDIAKLPEICALAEKYDARVMVDDSHALGVIGEGGRGTASYYHLEDKVDIIMGTFSKSLASLGGFMAASERVVNWVMHNSRPYIFSASMPPANCAAALTALRIIKREPERVKRLSDLSAYARAGFKKRNIPIIEATTPIIPVYTYEATNTLEKAEELYREGVYVNPVLPPATAPGNCLLRTSYMATLTYELIDEALDIFAKVFGK